MNSTEFNHVRETVETELGQSFEWREIDAGVNDVYVLISDERDLVLKVQTESGNEIKESIRVEPEIYSIISEETDIPSPKIFYENFQNEGKSFYVMEKMEGVNPVERWPEMSQPDREKLVFEYGRILGEIHNLRTFENSGRLKVQEDGIAVPKGCEWPERLRQKMINWKSKLNTSSELPNVPDFTEELFQEIPEAQPVLVHEDNRLDNMLIEGSKITAFLDWSGPEAGSKKYDLARAEYYLIDGDSTFPQREIMTSEHKNTLRKELIKGYRKENELEDDWLQTKERKIYRYAAILDIASGFQEWAKHFERTRYQETRKELSERIEAEQPKEFLN